MKLIAVDVDYRDETAVAAAVRFDGWTRNRPVQTWKVSVTDFEAYVPGAFYKRELPCILAVLKEIEGLPDSIVIDGYVSLGSERKPGLGQHLFDHLSRQVPVIGVAKTRFEDTPADCEVIRGRSRRPLYVTAAGLPLDDAKRLIVSMHGNGRIPTLLKLTDRLSRSQTAGGQRASPREVG